MYEFHCYGNRFHCHLYLDTPIQKKSTAPFALLVVGVTRQRRCDALHEDTVYGGWQQDTSMMHMERRAGIAPVAPTDGTTELLTKENFNPRGRIRHKLC